MLAERPLGQPDVDDDALVGVVVGVEDQALDRRVGIALGRRHALDDRLEDLGDAGAVLGRCEQDFLARHGQDVLQLLDHHVDLGRRQVDLVEDRDDRQVLLRARWTLASVWASIPCVASTTRIAPVAGLEASG